MHLPLIPPANLTATQRALYDKMRAGIGFTAIGENGTLLGPWNPWLHEPHFGGSIWKLIEALSASPTLPRPVREVAILVTGRSSVRLTRSMRMSSSPEQRGLSDEKLATIIAGRRPADLSREEAIAYNVAAALVDGHVLPERTYRQALAAEPMVRI